MSPGSPLSTSGRLARGPFVLAVVALYAASFGSQVLLSAPVNAWAGVWAFAAAQAVLIWVWYALHASRLRDAGRPAGLALGIALVYALEVALLTIVVWLILGAGFERGADGGQDAGILQLFVFVYLLALLTGDPTLGGLGYWIAGIVGLLLLPVAIGLFFSVWAATRPSVAASA